MAMLDVVIELDGITSASSSGMAGHGEGSGLAAGDYSTP
jgi:hypothetical protein